MVIVIRTASPKVNRRYTQPKDVDLTAPRLDPSKLAEARFAQDDEDKNNYKSFDKPQPLTLKRGTVVVRTSGRA